jgi:hypothetical protein
VPKPINHDRRGFLGTATMAIAAARLGMIGSAAAQSDKTKLASVPPIKPGTNTSFGPPQEAPQAFAEAVVEVDGY